MAQDWMWETAGEFLVPYILICTNSGQLDSNFVAHVGLGKVTHEVDVCSTKTVGSKWNAHFFLLVLLDLIIVIIACRIN